jgi:uncharacterized RDD family membrane protein YckC
VPAGYPPPWYPPPGYPPPGYPPPGYHWPVRPPLPVSPAGAPLADFGTRLLAYLIDAVLLSVVSMVFFVPAAVLVFRRLDDSMEIYNDTDPTPFFKDFFLPLLLLELGYFVLIVALRYLYEVELMHGSGQTLGKRIMKIRVAPIDPAARLTRGMAVKRYLVQFVAVIFVPFLGLVDGLWQLWDKPYQQTLHDKAAQTVVVKVLA